MKNKHITSLLVALLFLVSFTSFSQSNHNDIKSINKLIKKKRTYNKVTKTGYRIQLYNGLEKKAKNTRYRFKTLFPNTRTFLSYEAPEWKIQVGDYRTRLDADRALNQISEEFSGAIVIQLK